MSGRGNSSRWGLALLVWLLLAGTAWAQPSFPELTGRVVDRAGMLDQNTAAELTRRLAGFEQQSGIQLVVVTVPDLQGYAIEEFGYQLGRHWGIGQKGEDNGVLLLVAQTEREVRIEVGYGLEGTLTDALSINIIHNVIVPAFRQGQFAAGIEAGTAAIIAALQGTYEPPPQPDADEGDRGSLVMLFFFVVMMLLFSGLGGGPGRRRFGRRGAILIPGALGGMGGLGGGGFGGGFGGGGGGFGGGGASGGW